DKRDGEKKCYVICNAAEGEPKVFKDGYILDHYSKEVINGMKIALDFLKAEKGFIYLNSDYYRVFSKKLEKVIGDLSIEIFKKPNNAGYIGGEETVAINAIEGKRIEPRLKPPFPPTSGLWNCPTLVNNVETFYNVSLVAKGKYKNTRFYSINGDCQNAGVFNFPEDRTIEKILRETENYPDFDFFIQAGGGASGEVLNNKQLDQPAKGAGSITIYKTSKHKSLKLMKKWLDFFLANSCGQCTPCREGVYRLRELLNEKDADWKLFSDLLDNLDESSFCGLGCVVPIPLRSYKENVMKDSNS
ncbi:hypothetical protein J7J13_01880, partial [bacterium]|nr:hypothetical protein [bacterium]